MKYQETKDLLNLFRLLTLGQITGKMDLSIQFEEYIMKKFIISLSVAFLLLLALSEESFAVDPDMEIGITSPPFEITSQTVLFPIPGRYVYFVADTDMDIFFYHDRWYRPYKERWFRSTSYNGPWEHIREAPTPLKDLPPDYRSGAPRGFYRVPYGELRDKWESWEEEQYWDMKKDEEMEDIN